MGDLTASEKWANLKLCDNGDGTYSLCVTSANAGMSQHVTVDAMPSVAISSLPNVVVSSLPAVTATISSMPNVTANEPTYNFRNITSAATTVVKNATGKLKSLIINAAASLATATIYDNTAGSGTKIGTITMPLTLTAAQIVMPYNCTFSTGLTVVTTGGMDITVVYQ